MRVQNHSLAMTSSRHVYENRDYSAKAQYIPFIPYIYSVQYSVQRLWPRHTLSHPLARAT